MLCVLIVKLPISAKIARTLLGKNENKMLSYRRETALQGAL